MPAPASYNVFPFLRRILWEAPIQTIAELAIRKGDDVLDVGTNIGALAIAFARLTGSGGRVLGFECNPRMVEWARANAEVNEKPNVVIADRACFHASGLTLEFFADASTYSVGSSLIYKEGEGELIKVATTTIDDECENRRMSPTFIKIDVEGVEIDVLRGALKTIGRCQPVIIFERQNNLAPEQDPIVLLVGRGYSCFNVNTLQAVLPGWPGQAFPSNIVAFPPRISGGFELGARYSSEPSADGTSVRFTGLVEGLHHMELEIACASNALGELEVRDETGEQVVYFNCPASHLADPSCSSFPLNTSAGGELTALVKGDMRIISARLARVRAPAGILEAL